MIVQRIDLLTRQEIKAAHHKPIKRFRQYHHIMGQYRIKVLLFTGCGLECQNCGILSDDCTCSCPPGYFGEKCESKSTSLLLSYVVISPNTILPDWEACNLGNDIRSPTAIRYSNKYNVVLQLMSPKHKAMSRLWHICGAQPTAG